MNKGKFLVSIAAFALLLTACNDPLQQPQNVTCNPNPLTVVGNKVDATITGTFPAKEFNKKGVLIVTPVLKFNGQEVVGQSRTFVGEKAKVNGTTVNYKKGGTYKINASFDFVPEMAESELYLRFAASAGNKTYDVPELKVADGVITTAKLAAADAEELVPQVAADKFQRVIQETQEADIKFLIQQAELRSSETKSAAVADFTAAVKDAAKSDNKELRSLEITGYASPDGGIDLNTRLAEQRQKNTANFLNKQLKKDKVKVDVDAKTVNEDWEGFQKLMEQSNIQDKQLVLRVLSMYSDPEEREAQIKNLSAVYNTIADEILPALRRSRLILTTDLIGHSDEELLALADTAIETLTYDELLYTATLIDDNAKKAALYQQAIKLDGRDYRAYNNLALVQYEEGDITAARRNYENALKIAPNNADVNYNAGVAALADGDFDKAQQYFGKAPGTSGDLAAALGTMYTMQGDYAKAKKAYAGTNTNNAAIQQILDEDYAGARKTLAAVKEPNGTTYYLSAIVGARSNDRDAVYSNLRQAIAKDISLKTKAATDIEFAKYKEDATFNAIVK